MGSINEDPRRVSVATNSSADNHRASVATSSSVDNQHHRISTATTIDGRYADHRISNATTLTASVMSQEDDIIELDDSLQTERPSTEKISHVDYAESISEVHMTSIHPCDTTYVPLEQVETKGQERITIIEGTAPIQRTSHPVEPDSRSDSNLSCIKKTKFFQWVKIQCHNTDNRYAFQMAVAFSIAASFVMIEPISDFFPNIFWVGVSVVTVLDNTVGGFLNLSLQRLLGTLIGGAASIIIMTVTRAIFHPYWEWPAALMLGCLMFVQVFFISKLKMKPNMAYTGSIGLLTTCIILLSGYSDIIHDSLSYTAELGAWRTCLLIFGIFVALIVSLCVFPLKASKLMRKNLGKALEDAAELYKTSSLYYLDFGGYTTSAVYELLNASLPKDETLQHPMSHVNTNESNGTAQPHVAQQPISINEFFSNIMVTQPPGCQSQLREQIQETNRFWTHDTVTSVSNEAFAVLAKLQTESTRLHNVANENKVQVIFHIFGGGKERCKRDLRRAKRYNEVIEAMKRIVWPLVSFRLLLPLINLSQQLSGSMEIPATSSQESIDMIRERIRPTTETMQSFASSLEVMCHLGRILKDNSKPLSEFPEDWLEIDQKVMEGNSQIQRELKEIIRVCRDSSNVDGLKLLSYYGFLVRCSTIWDGLKTIVEKLNPLNGSLSRASSMGFPTPLPEREIIHAPE